MEQSNILKLEKEKKTRKDVNSPNIGKKQIKKVPKYILSVRRGQQTSG